METAGTLPPITEQIKQYFETKYKLLKYESIDKASSIIAEIIIDIIMVFLSLITFIFFCITLVLFAAYLLNSAWEGFGCVTLLSALIALSSRFFHLPIQNILVRKFIEKLFRNRDA